MSLFPAEEKTLAPISTLVVAALAKADAFDAANSTFNNTAGYYTQGDVQTALQEAGAKLAAALLKNGGSFTGVAKAMANPTDAEPQLRNVVVVDAGTDISTLSVTAGTIVMVRK